MELQSATAITTDELISLTNKFTYLWTTVKGKSKDDNWQYHTALTKWKCLSEFNALFTSIERDMILKNTYLSLCKYNSYGFSVPIKDIDIKLLYSAPESIHILIIDKDGCTYEIKGLSPKSLEPIKTPPSLISVTCLDDMLAFNDTAYFDLDLSYKTNKKSVDIINLHRMNLSKKLSYDIFWCIEKYLCGVIESFAEARTMCIIKDFIDGCKSQISIGLYGLESKRVLFSRKL